MKYFQIIALPISYLYGFIGLLRNLLYDWGMFSSKEFDVTVLSVGNLSTGGTGKTPHIEYLIRLLQNEFSVATLSRGYGRKTKGFILADLQSSSEDIGDEPRQFKHKFNDLPIAVDEKRVRGINILLKNFPSLNVILLDDAFQHRAVKPGLSMVLSDFSKIYYDDFVLPSGNLREFRSGIKRADIIIITKCNEILLPIERNQLIKKINPLPHQQVYFSYISYGEFVPLIGENLHLLSKAYYFERKYSIVLLTGIADTASLEYFLKDKVSTIIPAPFPDHHPFTKNDLLSIQKIFDNIASANKIILTTEKDAMRLKSPEFSDILKTMPIFYIPIEINFHDNNNNEFNQQILHYVRTNQKHSSVHSK